MAALDDGLRVKAWMTLARTFLRSNDFLVARLQAGTPLALTTLEILLRVEDEGGVVGQRTLLEGLGVSQSWISRLLSKMEADGLIERERIENNRRSSRISIRPAGRNLLAEGVPAYLEGLRAVFAGLKRRDLSELTLLLDRVTGDHAAPDGEASQPHDLSRILATLGMDASTNVNPDDVRKALEPLVAREAALFRRAENVDAMRRQIVELSRAIDRPSEFLQGERNLHRVKAECVRSSLLRAAYEGALKSGDDRPETLARSHLPRRLALLAEIVEAIADADADRAAACASA